MKAYSTLLCFILPVSILFAQQNKTTLSKKWTNMLENAETYEPYKVIKKVELQDFWKNTSDSLNAYQRAVITEKNTVTQQAKEIVELKTSLAQLNGNIVQLKQGRDDVSFLGISTNKYFYLSVLYLLLVGAVVLIVAFFYRYKKSQLITVQKVDAFKKLEQEFTEYKQTKFEVERKLKRDLQTQINELEELKKKL